MPTKLDPMLLADLATSQWGMFTTAQARKIGANAQQVAHLARTGTLERVRHGVYRIAGTPDSQADSARAAWMALEPTETVGSRLEKEEPGGVISYLSAANLRHLGDLPEALVDITVVSRRQTRLPDIRFHVARLEPHEWSLVAGLPVTAPARTIQDLARDHLDGDHLGRIVRDSLVTNLIDLSTAAATLRPFAHLYGAPLGAGDIFLDRLLDEAGLPTAVLELAARRTSRPAESVVDMLAKILLVWMADRSGRADPRVEAILRGIGPDRLPDIKVLQEIVAGKSPADFVRGIASDEPGE